MSHPAVKEARTEIPQIAAPDAVAGKPHADHNEEHEESHGLDWIEVGRVLFVAAAAVAIWFLRGTSVPYRDVIGAVCALAGGFPIYHEAYENIVERRMTMELSMAIAIVAALAIRETFTALVITVFVLAAEILEGLTVGRGRNAIQRLLDLLPNMATVRRGIEWKDCAIDEVRAGDAVLARPGANVVLIGNDLSKFTDTIRVARQCRRIIMQNFYGHAGGGRHRHRPGRGRGAEPFAGRVHSCHLGARIHPEFHASHSVAARTASDPGAARVMIRVSLSTRLEPRVLIDGARLR